MRLTLRTMLAYMDEQLDPPQMEEIGAKIRESGVATGMIDRVRASMRKHRMEAPKLDGRGIGKDANSVSEYLDNVLDKDEIPEIEQLCLNSDMHLAEVAACHQMLSQLPGVEFDISHRLRDRIYDIPGMLTERAAEEAGDDEAAVAKPKHGTVRDPAADALKKRRKKKTPKVPEYFKTQPTTSRAWLPLALTAALVLLGIAFGAYVTRDQWLKNFAKQTAATSSPATSDSNNKAEPNVKENTSTEPEAVPNDSNSTAKADESGSSSPGEDSEKKADENAEKKSASDVDQVKIDESNPIVESSTAPPPPISDAPPATEDSKPVEATDDDKALPAIAKLPVLASSVPVVAWDTAAKGWSRVREGESLPEGGAIALVGTRAKVKTQSGLTATLVGPTEVRFLKDSARGDLAWVLDSARVLFDATDAGGSAVKTVLAGTPVSMKFVSPDSQLAIEVVRRIQSGADPTNPDEFTATTQLLLLRGAVQVKVGEEEHLINRGPELKVIEIDSMGVIKEIEGAGAPLWVDELTAGEATKQASKELSDRLANVKTPLSIALQELASDNRVNVASLAAQSLAQLEQIKPLCDQFRDVHYRAAWRNNHAFLKHLLQSAPGAADMIRQQLDEHYPSESAPIYRLLRGFDQDQFAQEGQMLIGGLQSESQLLRVLSYQTLVDLVGPGGRKYQPEDPAPVRAKHVLAWVEAFEAGKLKVKSQDESK